MTDVEKYILIFGDSELTEEEIMKYFGAKN